LWAEHGDLLDSSEEVRIRVRALEAKMDLLQVSINQLISSVPPDQRAKAAVNSRQLQARPNPLQNEKIEMSVAVKGAPMRPGPGA
jgi:hypothetical protein